VKLLLVAQIAPPSSLVSARRVAAMTKYLARDGFDVTVFASDASGEGEIEGAVDVVRTNDLLTSRLNWRRRQFSALIGSSRETYAPPSRLASIVVPDLSVGTWIPFALPAALKLARERRFDCVLTTSPPPSTHLIGAALRRRGIPWVAELRDGWAFEPPHAAWPLGVQARLDRGLERRILRAADAVIAVTQPIVDDLRQRLGIEAVLITNGYDPEELPAGGVDDLLQPDRHSLVHTGRLSLSGVSLERVLEGLRMADVKQLEVVFAGSVTEEERRALTAPDLAQTVRFLGWLDRPRALALQWAADTLLVITEGAKRRSVTTGKLYEYLATGRPILVLGEETEAARIVVEAGAGFAAPASDPAAIAEALGKVVFEPLSAPEPSAAREFAYPGLAARLATVIEGVAYGR
jgi:glycosyltransferase involved in cell wall biosynthesis